MDVASGRPQIAQGRVALITGGSRGIGLAVARRLVDEGARVVITGRSAERLAEVAATFPDGFVLTVAGRADDAAHRAEVYRAVAAAFGRLDILVCSAGINPAYGPLADLDLDTARKILEVNLVGPLAWTQEALRAEDLGFRANRGSVVIVSSVTGQVPSSMIGWYGVSKAANAHLARTLAVELAPEIRVNAIAPAVIKTNFSRALYESGESELARQYPLQRLGTPEDVAGTVAYLVSPDADWITGQVITVDGGLLASGGTA